jgi:glycine cleavage system H protein
VRRFYFEEIQNDFRSQTICDSLLATALFTSATMELIRFKHARFSTRLPADFMYSPSHYWMAKDPQQEGLWRVGFTKFATRMLGELVEAEFETKIGSPVEPGQPIGWVEGFKAASDVFCTMEGTFQGGNPILDEDACIVRSSPYVDGWLYSVQGKPESDAMDVQGYIELLDKTITTMQEDPQYD